MLKTQTAVIWYGKRRAQGKLPALLSGTSAKDTRRWSGFEQGNAPLPMQPSRFPVFYANSISEVRRG